MSGAEFPRAVVVSRVATSVATVYGYWETSIGLPKLDFATLLGRKLVLAAAETALGRMC